MRRVALTAGAVLLLAAAGCGGGGGGERLSREDYVAQADAICKEVEQKADELAAPGSIQEIPPYVDGALPIFDEGLERLEALRPPEDLRDKVDDWLAAGDRTRELLADLKAAAEEGDAAKVREIGARGDMLDEETDRLARELGLVECAND